jgi:mRNA deadenylase 3'-5' endonuclease subunit Ccr4
LTDLQKNGVKIGVNGVRNLAEELQKKSLQIKERVLGEAHPDTIMSYNNLANIYI